MSFDYQTIAAMIRDSVKKTTVRIILKGKLGKIDWKSGKYFGTDEFGWYIGEWNEFEKIKQENKDDITDFHVECDHRNSALPFLDFKKQNARIEPGAIIRDGADIGEQAVIMMGAVINIGAQVGARAMIDMNAVLGARAVIGENSHIGAGAVIAGVLEPPSADPVRIGRNVLIGANAVVLEGVTVGDYSVIGAGSVVTKNIPEYSLAFGIPAKVIRSVDSRESDKTRILEELRKL